MMLALPARYYLVPAAAAGAPVRLAL